MSNYKAELTHPTDSTGAAARPAFAEWNGGRHALRASAHRLAQFWPLTKPRITQMTVFCAVIGSLLACDGAPDWRVLAWSAVGIWLLAGAAFAVNCLLEAAVDARMARTARRASARGDLNRTQTVALSATMGASGAAVLWTQVNPLTMWLTLATFAGYAFVYTLLLKPYTSQNIVIGGLAGAMPPALGWAAVMNTVPIQAWLLVLIIFLWTPPHFWALAMYRRDDYARSGLPMLPVTHGMAHTGRAVWRYSTALAGACILPWAIGASGALYLASAAALNAVFLRHAWKLHKHYTDQSARKAFAWSILYLALLFVALLADHYWR